MSPHAGGLPRLTLRGPAAVDGVGLFTARRTRATIHPAPAGAGITFQRADLPGAAPIPASIASLAHALRVIPGDRTPRSTSLQGPGEGNSAATVEHILSALAGMGITDAVLSLDGPEVPIADGSALPFVEAMRHAGIAALGGGVVGPLIVTRPITVEAGPGGGGGRIVIEPRDRPGAEYIYCLDYGASSTLPPQRIAFAGTGEEYARWIAPARTFCLLEEAVAMRAMGLFGHLGAREMLVIGPDGPIDNTLRFEDEPARHKLLDLIGDLALIGAPLNARIVAERSGHALNHAAARALVEAFGSDA